MKAIGRARDHVLERVNHRRDHLASVVDRACHLHLRLSRDNGLPCAPERIE
jgi:hypothetical protein